MMEQFGSAISITIREKKFHKKENRCQRIWIWANVGS